MLMMINREKIIIPEMGIFFNSVVGRDYYNISNI